MARRLIWLPAVLGVVSAAGCGKSQPADSVPAPTAPLPTAGVAGRPVTVYPLTLIAVEASLGWQDSLRPREAALEQADSIIAEFLLERAPEVTWVLPDVMRQLARQAPAILSDPGQVGTALLRSPEVSVVPDPLRSQMRNLTGVAGDRFALVPAALAFYHEPDSLGRAELTMVMVDVRRGLVGWRTVARGSGADPWVALREALEALVPGLP